MPRPKKPGAPERKRRSRNGCWPCKRRKIKCGEERPACSMCTKSGEACDYSMRLNWHGREKRTNEEMLSVDAPSTSTSQTKRARADYLSPMGVAERSNSSGTDLRTSSTGDDAARRPASTGNMPFSNPWQAPDSEERPRSTTELASGRGELRFRAQAPFVAPHGMSAARDARLDVRMPLTPNTPGRDFSAPSTATLHRDSDQASDADRRKLSIRSLLAHPVTSPETDRSYGVDQGRRDMDLPRNDDLNALVPFSPSVTLRKLKFPGEEGDVHAEEVDDIALSVELDDPQLGASKYYSSSVPVTIPLSLEPLPALLQNNPMNLLYFHHFLNHTARLLVLHDCPYNVLRNVLPQMAIHNENLLNLLLAYAAHHRARLLRYPEPVNRIAQWVSLVFTELRYALVDTKEGISDANVAAAIMLASLEVISPNAFEASSISWQDHLGLAREFIILRGGYSGLRSGDTVSRFLSRWFAYLDVLGSLSGGQDRPLPDARGLDDIPEEANENDDKIDCFLGFTGRCINLLHEIARLTKECELERVGLSEDELQSWQPSEAIAQRAYYVENLLQHSRSAAFSGCGVRDDADVTINEAYHLAGLIHLYRRVLDIPHSASEVVGAVESIFSILDTADDRRLGVLIFPIFTAGFYTLYPDRRAVSYLRRIENLGMAQAGKARELLENLEQNPQTWEQLMAGELPGKGPFIG